MRQTDICIVGAGISGLALAHFLRQEAPGRAFLVLEKEARAGGAIRTYQKEGYLAEQGPHGFLDTGEDTLALVRLAGLEAELVSAPLGRFARYLCLGGRLLKAPQTPPQLIMTPLLSWPAKIGVLLRELRQPCLTGSPTIAQWVTHRLGPAMLPFADAVYTGTYAGDINRLCIDGAMPGLRSLEREHGSLIKALFVTGAKRRTQKQAGQAKKGLPAMLNFTRGMESLPQALAGRLQESRQLLLNSRVRAVRRQEEGWLLEVEHGAHCLCRELVLALPINAALALLMETLPELPPPACVVPGARLVSVLLGFGAEAKIPFGFGYLAPENERRFSLGALFSTHMLPGRAPAGHQLVEVLVGGRRHPERLELGDSELTARVLEDLGHLIVLPKPPAFTSVLRESAAIPQAESEHLSLVAWRDQWAGRYPSLHALGFGWNGIGLNEMTREARALARALGGDRASAPDRLKGVYL